MEKSKKIKPLPWEEIKREMLPTKEDRERYEYGYKKFIEQCRKEYLQELGAKIRKTREEEEVSQSELARRLRTSKSTISRVEAGDQNLTVKYILRIADALGKRYEINIY